MIKVFQKLQDPGKRLSNKINNYCKTNRKASNKPFQVVFEIRLQSLHQQLFYVGN